MDEYGHLSDLKRDVHDRFWTHLSTLGDICNNVKVSILL